MAQAGIVDRPSPVSYRMPMMDEMPLSVLRYGVDEPLPVRRPVRAGPFTALLEGGFLRYVTLGSLEGNPQGGQEVLRGIYAAVRDHNWGTVAPHFTRYDVQQTADSFRVRFTAEHHHAEVDFAWDGDIEGTAEGTLTYHLVGSARRTFLRNRIGFCVLHPMTLAGTPVEVETPSGLVSGVFPLEISPHQPFKDIVALRQATPWGTVEVRFAGDLFEMEDQRNWTDASYKTYCTPLALPFPVQITAGTRVEQSVTLRVIGAPFPPAPSPRGTGQRAEGHAGEAFRTPLTTSAPPRGASQRAEGHNGGRIAVTPRPVGTLPPIGLGVASHGEPLTTAEIDHLRRLRPAHLRVTLDLTGTAWEAHLQRAAAEGASLDAALELEVIAGDDGAGLERLARALQGLARLQGPNGDRPPITRALIFPQSGVVTTEPVLAAARRAFRATGVATPLGGGTRADFVDLNRATLPLPLMDLAGYAVNPQVHAFDNLSLVETLAAQAVTVENTRRITADLPVAVGPVTLRQRINPAATAAEREASEAELSPRVDPRQLSLFAAGWTLGSLRHLAGAGAASLTYFETTGRLGVMERRDGGTPHPRFPAPPGTLFPLYHLLAAVADFAGGDRLDADIDAPLAPLAIEALALRSERRCRLLVANLTADRRRVTVTGPPLSSATVRTLDETNAGTWRTDPDFLRASIGDRTNATRWEGTLDLLPFAIAVVDDELND